MKSTTPRPLTCSSGQRRSGEGRGKLFTPLTKRSHGGGGAGGAQARVRRDDAGAAPAPGDEIGGASEANFERPLLGFHRAGWTTLAPLSPCQLFPPRSSCSSATCSLGTFTWS